MLTQEADVKITPAAKIKKNSILIGGKRMIYSPHRKETAMFNGAPFSYKNNANLYL